MSNVDCVIPGLTSVVTTSTVRAVNIGSSEIIASLHTVCIDNCKTPTVINFVSVILFLVSFLF